MKKVKGDESYMKMSLYAEGKGAVYLFIPTLWDAVNNQWMGFVQTPKTKKIISAVGKDSVELQNNFNICLSQALQEMPDEVLSMFKPLEYWEK